MWGNIIKRTAPITSIFNETVNFLWAPSHVGFAGNESADRLVFSTKFSVNYCSLKKPPFSDLLQIYKKIVWNAWQSEWSSLCLLAQKYFTRVPSRFSGVSLPRIVGLSLSAVCALDTTFSFLSAFNSSPLCAIHPNGVDCDLRHILFVCPFLSPTRNILSSRLCSLGYLSSAIHLLLDFRFPLVNFTVFSFILYACFLV